MTKLAQLLERQARLKSEVGKNLDILIGSVVKSPAMKNHALTDKVRGKTVSRYVRQGIVPEAKRMTANTQKLWKQLRVLSAINWKILQARSELSTPDSR